MGQLFRTGRIEKDEAEHLLSFCNNAGPSFILGVVGLGCFQSLRVGAILYTIHALSAGLVGMLLPLCTGILLCCLLNALFHFL